MSNAMTCRWFQTLKIITNLKDGNHYFERSSSDEKYKLSLMFVKPEGLLVYIKQIQCFNHSIKPQNSDFKSYIYILYYLYNQMFIIT